MSYALDLAHTRPHRAKLVYSEDGELLINEVPEEITPQRLRILTKTLRPVLTEFEKRVRANVERVPPQVPEAPAPAIVAGDAQCLPLHDQSVDLIVTSPPYASNAIDYMRAHKFSLVWLGYSIDALSEHRHKYIGDELARNVSTTVLPQDVERVLALVAEKSATKMLSIRRYYVEMSKVLSEMYRVLRPGRAAIVVVGIFRV